MHVANGLFPFMASPEESQSVRPEPWFLDLYLLTIWHQPGGAERDTGWGATCWPRIQARRCLPSRSWSLLQCRGPNHRQECWPVIVEGGRGRLRDVYGRRAGFFCRAVAVATGAAPSESSCVSAAAGLFALLLPS